MRKLTFAQRLIILSSELCPLSADNGGGERDRTDDLLRARQALSQLSYTPISFRSQKSDVRGQINQALTRF